jgi:hypothetical protein
MTIIKAAELGKKVLDDYNAAMEEQDKIKQGVTLIDVVARHEKEIQELKRLVTPMMEFKQEKPKHDPVATKNKKGLILHVGWDDLPDGTQIYTSPHQREWVGLTDAELHEICNSMDYYGDRGLVELIESKLKEKNGG